MHGAIFVMHRLLVDNQKFSLSAESSASVSTINLPTILLTLMTLFSQKKIFSKLQIYVKFREI